MEWGMTWPRISHIPCVKVNKEEIMRTTSKSKSEFITCLTHDNHVLFI